MLSGQNENDIVIFIDVGGMCKFDDWNDVVGDWISYSFDLDWSILDCSYICFDLCLTDLLFSTDLTGLMVSMKLTSLE